ncbi:cytochrome b-c1 complex subunit 6, mitochondrial-like [Haematobia irritans]|uniref:cytochrome b-c1 complex subunit 6, mitochondrial-like n=1 Tax=Haematobia irritans TaxID=7368 RepID=UPI003F4F8190
MDILKNFQQKFFASIHAAKPVMESNEDDADAASNAIDPQEELREKCGETHRITKLYEMLQECNDRVNSKTKTMETCEQELFDYIHAIDHCVAKTLFSRLV